ncbi:hypothetical protein ACR6EC_07375 [Bacillus subtilis]|uniref:hypothetical protein n=1 Tax=Bacillus subtilis TaxID=1423 RepID=UPI003EBD806F
MFVLVDLGSQEGIRFVVGIDPVAGIVGLVEGTVLAVVDTDLAGIAPVAVAFAGIALVVVRHLQAKRP